MSALTSEISCEICVRALPCSFAASGMDVTWLSASRALLRCALAEFCSGCAPVVVALGGGGCWDVVAGGCWGVVAGGCCAGGCCCGCCCDGGSCGGGVCVDCAYVATGSAISAAAATAVDHRAFSIGETLLWMLISFLAGR